MGREIELKIPLEDFQYDYILSFLFGRKKICGIERSEKIEKIEKSDEYYSLYKTPEELRKNGEPQVIRIRTEEKTDDFCTESLPSGGDFSEKSGIESSEIEVLGIESSEIEASSRGGFSSENFKNVSGEKKSFFCIKRKTLENGVEFNSENETYVEDADVIRDLLKVSNYHIFFQKHKSAFSAYCTAPDILKSAFHLELETVNNLKYLEVEVTEENENPKAVRLALEKFVSILGVDPGKRDSRSWMEILCAQKGGEK